MLTTLSTQSELARMPADPRERLRTYQDDPLVEDDHFGKLDESKQDALRSIWSTGPGQFVVGPPGVGKTRLVTEVVRRALAGDPTIRLLLSASASSSGSSRRLRSENAEEDRVGRRRYPGPLQGG